MKIFCLGDSLTEGDYGVLGKRGIKNVQKENYPYYLSLSTGAETVNLGHCGATATTYLKFYRENGHSVAGADLILVMLGTNGGFSVEKDTDCNRDFYTLMDICKTEAPDAKIVLLTPPYCTSDPAYSNAGYIENAVEGGKFVKRTAKDLGLLCIDMLACPDFGEGKESVMQPNDGLHFTKEGYFALARYIEANLKKLKLL